MLALAHFTLRLLLGTTLVLALMPRKDVAAGFFRVLMLLILGLSVLLALASPAARMVAIAIALVSFVGSVLWTLNRRTGGTWAIGLVLAGTLVGLYQVAPGDTGAASETSLTMHYLAELTSAALLGSALTGMLLGHRYLTAPGMPLAPLVRLNQFLATAAVARGLLSLVVFLMFSGQLESSTHWTWLGLRWLAGIAGPLAAWAMVREILRYRNTQSATGVLFVAVILTFIGELSADLLEQSLHVPF